MIIPEIFHTLYEVKSTQKSEDVDMVLLREPKDSGYYEFSANDELVITKGHNNFTPKEEAKAAAYPYGETGLLYRPCVLQLHTEMLCPHRPENRKDNTSRCRTDGYVYPYV